MTAAISKWFSEPLMTTLVGTLARLDILFYYYSVCLLYFSNLKIIFIKKYPK